MKLEQLEIHNIASIKDATIDFTEPPLSDADVFLISGKTGAGKSTILDAICLALYNNTPRLESTRMEGGLIDEGIRKANSSKVVVKANSSAQLLSRDCGEGYVKLRFKGNNNCRYEAVWSIARAYKNPQKALGKPIWELRNLDTGIYLSRKGEIRSEITRAVGLDFNQFCRTTMLAQGAFSRFLDSTDDEKSEILEKITGVDIYTRVGKKIYEITAGKKEAFLIASSKAQDISLLSEDEISSIRKSIISITASIKTAELNKRSCEEKSLWLKNAKLFADEAEKAKARLSTLRDETATPQNKDNRILINEFDSTREPRESILALRKAAADRRKLKRERQLLSQRMQQVAKSLAGVELQISNSEEKISKFNTLINASSAHATIFKEKDTIIANLTLLESLRRDIKHTNEEITRNTRHIEGSLKTTLEEADKRLIAAIKNIADLDTEIASLSDEIEQRGLARLRNERNIVSDTITDITTLSHTITDFETETLRLQKAKKSIELQNKHSEELKALITDISKEAEVLKAECETIDSTLSMQRKTVEDWVHEARARLSIGDICPVCNQKVAILPPADDLLREIFEKTKLLAIERRKEYDAKMECLNGYKAELKQVEASITEQKKEIADLTTLTSLKAKIAELAHKCGFEDGSKLKSDDLQRILAEHINCKSVIDKEIASLNETEKALNQRRQLRPNLERKKEQCDILKDAAQKEINDMLTLIETDRTLLKDQQMRLDDIIAQISCKINSSEWDSNWLAETDSFTKELIAKSDAYDKAKSKKTELENFINHLRSVATTVASTLEDIQQCGLRLHVKPIDKITQIAVERLISSASELLAAAKTNSSQLIEVTSAIEAARLALTSYRCKSGNIAISRILYLALIDYERINMIRDQIHRLDMKISEAEGAMVQATSNIATHAMQRPVISAADTIASLDSEAETLQKKILENSASKGAIEQELATDTENRRRMQSMVEEREKARVEFEKWSLLSNLAGSADGKAFRKIAQSYVLSGLVNSANYYMAQLTDRYRLISTPGSFLLSIEDAYQGYVSRATSTISGGETFLVSLSLAIALSDIGGGLTVDTLFIDEGFGTLSGESLSRAIDTLRMLHTRSGRKIGIISHIEELKEQIPVQIRVSQRPGSPWSTVKTLS